MKETYECIIIGGGFAGLQASIQLGRYKRKTLVIDSNYGRSTYCKSYRNILGWPNGISGLQLRELGKKQATEYGVSFIEDKVMTVKKKDIHFEIVTEKELTFFAKTILLATGLLDRIPDIKHIFDCLGTTIYVCPDCDGYEISDRSVLVLGAGIAGANMALEINYWTSKITYINHDGEELETDVINKLRQKGISYQKEKIIEIVKDEDSNFKGITLQSGEFLLADRAFIGFGGNEIHNELAKQLGVELLNNKHVIVNPRTKETNVPNVWSAGDLVAHSQQVTIAMGEGTQAAVWIHKRLLECNDSL